MIPGKIFSTGFFQQAFFHKFCGKKPFSTKLLFQQALSENILLPRPASQAFFYTSPTRWVHLDVFSPNLRWCVLCRHTQSDLPPLNSCGVCSIALRKPSSQACFAIDTLGRVFP